jgi:hypothetical protein
MLPPKGRYFLVPESPQHFVHCIYGTDDGSQSSTQKRIELLKNDEGGVSVYIYESLTVDQSEQHV